MSQQTTRSKVSQGGRELIHVQFSAIVKTAAYNLGREAEFTSAVVKVIPEYKRTKKLSLIAQAAKTALGVEWYRSAYADVSDPELFDGLEWTVKRIEEGKFDG